MLSSTSLKPLAIALIAAVAGCHTEAIEPHTAPLSTPPAANAPPQSPGDQDAEPKAGPRREEAPSLALEEVEGADLARTRAAFAEVPARIKRCAAPGAGALLSVRIKHTPSSTHLAVEPTGSLDREGRHCVLESLSVVDYDGVLEQGSPSNRPSNFTAHLRIEW